MKHNELNKFEQAFKDKIEEIDFPYQEADWSDLQSAMQQRKGPFWSSAAAKVIAGILVISSAVGIAITSNETEPMAKDSIAIPVQIDQTIEDSKESNVVNAAKKESQAEKINKKPSIKENQMLSQEEESPSIDAKEDDVLIESEEIVMEAEEPAQETETKNSAVLSEELKEQIQINWSGKACLNTVALFEVQSLNNDNPNLSLTWKLNGELMNSSSDGSIELFIENPGTYTLEASTKSSSDRIEFFVEEMPVADFRYEEQKGVYTDKIAILKGQPSEYSYSWEIEGMESRMDGNDVAIEFETFGVYDVDMIYTTNNGCQYVISKPVAIVEDFKPYVPTHFSPNGDGTNDSFIPVGFADVEGDYTFSIFNDKGQLIFQTKDKSVSWDGADNITGRKLFDGYFVWQVSLNNKEQIKTFSGKIKIMN